jgi:hypothetical protein
MERAGAGVDASSASAAGPCRGAAASAGAGPKTEKYRGAGAIDGAGAEDMAVEGAGVETGVGTGADAWEQATSDDAGANCVAGRVATAGETTAPGPRGRLALGGPPDSGK